MMDAYAKAATNRSIRTIQTELDFLLDSSLLTADQVASIHALLPSAPELSRASSAAVPKSASPPPTQALATTHITPPQPSPSPSPAAPPPAYQVASPQAPACGYADALYAYAPADAGDLALAPGDRVAVTAHLNADWARGRNERDGQEGIFPRSYVRPLDEKAGPPAPQPQPGYGYGSMPLEVAHGGHGQQQPPPAEAGPVAEGQGPPSKVNQQGKKFGKKLGNAAIFGAGATIGSNIVNGIF